MTPRRARSWACPRCYEVVPGLVRVRWAEGLADCGPVWMCPTCLAALRGVADGPPFGTLMDERPYAIVVIERRGDDAPLRGALGGVPT